MRLKSIICPKAVCLRFDSYYAFELNDETDLKEIILLTALFNIVSFFYYIYGIPSRYKNIKMNVLPEFLIGVLFSKRQIIAFSSSKFHKVFFKMKKKPDYLELFYNIPFSGSPVNPFSEVLDEALFNMQFAGALRRLNPELVTYSVTEDFKDAYKILSEGIDQPTMNKAQKLCDEILQMLDT